MESNVHEIKTPKTGNPYIRDLTIETISNGKALEIVNEELAKVAKDIITRPGLNEKRTVTLTIELKPDMPQDNGEIYPSVDWSVKSSVPGKKGITARAFIEEGKLKLNTAIQQTFVDY